MNKKGSMLGWILIIIVLIVIIVGLYIYFGGSSEVVDKIPISSAIPKPPAFPS